MFVNALDWKDTIFVIVLHTGLREGAVQLLWTVLTIFLLGKYLFIRTCPLGKGPGKVPAH